MKNKFNERVRELRLSKHLLQKDFAKAIGFSRASITDWEVGGHEPSFDTLIKIAEYFDVSTDYLLGITDYD